LQRKFAVVVMGALDQVPALLNALYDEKHKDVREAAVIALRHWMGRGEGQAQKLYNVMLEDKNIPKIRARILLNLLDGFHDDDLRKPFTYDLLILFMDGKDLAVRELSWWHLQRLARVGETGYDPAGTEESRREAIARIRKIIPPGELPKSN
jgi:hypothetical protein